MANSSRSNIIRFLAFTVLALVFVPTSKAEQLPPAAEEMAKAYGLDSWGQIEGIRYTWNAEFPGSVKPFDGGSGTIKVSLLLFSAQDFVAPANQLFLHPVLEPRIVLEF